MRTEGSWGSWDVLESRGCMAGAGWQGGRTAGMKDTGARCVARRWAAQSDTCCKHHLHAARLGCCIANAASTMRTGGFLICWIA